MAVTRGHGNPDWTRDETILALALYFDTGKIIPPDSSPYIRDLSKVLRAMPYHEIAARKKSFRNPAGVSMKLQNLRSVEVGHGLSNSKMDRFVWEEFGNRPEEAKQLALLIREGIQIADKSVATTDDEPEEEFYEGKLITALHKVRERSPSIRAKLLAARRKHGKLTCELCLRHSLSQDKNYEDATFEGHHLRPLATLVAGNTKLADMALVCASCHRLIHRAIAKAKRWLSLEDCRTEISLRLMP